VIAGTGDSRRTCLFPIGGDDPKYLFNIFKIVIGGVVNTPFYVLTTV